MRTLHAQTVKPRLISAKKVVRLERSGRYEEALDMFGENWDDPGFFPDMSGLTEVHAAEQLLRFGALIGFIGYKRQTAASQERSKDLLINARDRYSALGHLAKVAECENYIALSYWRTGEPQEALVWIDTALSYDLPTSADARLYAIVTKSILLVSTKQDRENIEHCLAAENEVRRFGDAFLNGCLCSNIALSLKNCSQYAEALQYLNLARIFHRKSRHKLYLGTVENNLAQLYRLERRFEAAHEAADNAIRVYKQLRDKTREASTIDTKALIYLAERKLPEALAAADKSIAMLKKTEITASLAESLMTKSKVLLFADDLSEAIVNLIEAVNLTRVQDSEAAAKGLINEFSEALKEKDMLVDGDRSIDTDKMELVLPSSIAHYPEYKGVWINNEHLENMGIHRGSLAIVVNEKIKRGDLVAIAELKSELVTCGFYDAEFGIICLERGDDDPQLFNEKDIRVLGKIIGVCNSGKDATGKMRVEAIIR